MNRYVGALRLPDEYLSAANVPTVELCMVLFSAVAIFGGGANISVQLLRQSSRRGVEEVNVGGGSSGSSDEQD